MGVAGAEALHARRTEDDRELAEVHRRAIDDLLSEVKASAVALERLLDSPELAEASTGDLQVRLELSRRLREHRARRTTWT
jgi:hypothetical protein